MLFASKLLNIPYHPILNALLPHTTQSINLPWLELIPQLQLENIAKLLFHWELLSMGWAKESAIIPLWCPNSGVQTWTLFNSINYIKISELDVIYTMTSQTGQIRGFLWEICRQNEWAVDRKKRDVRHEISSPLTHLDMYPFRV